MAASLLSFAISVSRQQLDAVKARVHPVSLYSRKLLRWKIGLSVRHRLISGRHSITQSEPCCNSRVLNFDFTFWFLHDNAIGQSQSGSGGSNTDCVRAA
jgi:hypothetical protein